jgi:hypothetical protein
MTTKLTLARCPDPSTVRGSEHVQVIVPRCPMFDFDGDNDQVPEVAALVAAGFRPTGHADGDTRPVGEVVYDTRTGNYTG